MRVLFLAVWLAGCASAQPPATSPAPGKTLLASIMMTESALQGPVKRKTGFEFYVVATPPGLAGPLLEGQEFRDGKVVDSFDWGSAADEVEAIEKAGLVPFDFNREITEVSDRLRKQAVERGELFAAGTRDGAEWEIVIVTASGRFTLRAWNPLPQIDALAPHSAKLAKLKTVVDLLAQYYGRLKLGL